MMLRGLNLQATNGYRAGPEMTTYCFDPVHNFVNSIKIDEPSSATAASYEINPDLHSEELRIPARGFFRPLSTYRESSVFWTSAKTELSVVNLISLDVNLDLFFKLAQKYSHLDKSTQIRIFQSEAQYLPTFNSGDLIVATPNLVNAIVAQEANNPNRIISILRVNKNTKIFYYSSAKVSELPNLKGVYIPVNSVNKHHNFNSEGSFLDSKTLQTRTWLYIPSNECNLTEVLTTKELPNQIFTAEISLLLELSSRHRSLRNIDPASDYDEIQKTSATGIVFPPNFVFPEVNPKSCSEIPALKYASLLTENSEPLADYNNVVKSIETAKFKQTKISENLLIAKDMLVNSEKDLEKRLKEIEALKAKIKSLESQQVVLKEKQEAIAAILTELTSKDIAALLAKVFEQDVDFTILNNIAESRGIYIQELVLGNKSTKQPINIQNLGNTLLSPSEIYVHKLVLLYRHPIKIVPDSHTSNPKYDRAIAGGPYLIKLDFSAGPAMHIALPTPNAFYYHHPTSSDVRLHPHAQPTNISDKTKAAGIWSGTCTGEITSMLSTFSGLLNTPMNIPGLIILVDSWIVNAVTSDLYGESSKYFPPWKEEYRTANLDTFIESKVSKFDGCLYLQNKSKGNKAFIVFFTGLNVNEMLVLEGFFNTTTEEFTYRRTYGQIGHFDDAGLTYYREIKKGRPTNIVIKQLSSEETIASI